MPKVIWTSKEKEFLLENWEKMTPAQIAKYLRKTENAVICYALRKRLSHTPKVKKNLLKEVLCMRFIRPELFNPDRRFLREVGMSQIRFWRVYRGEESLTQKEYMKLVLVLGITLEQAFEARQLKLFDDDKTE